MRKLFSIGRYKFFWANRTDFTYPGVHMWNGTNHVRLIPIPK